MIIKQRVFKGWYGGGGAMVKSFSGVSVIIIISLLLSNCTSVGNTVKVDEATAARLRSDVTIYDSKQLSGLDYKTVQQLNATACDSRENAMDQLRYFAHLAGANGVAKIKCDKFLGPIFMQNCVTTIMCEAIAIKVGTTAAETEKTEKPSGIQIMSQGEGFTLGKLPIVVTSYDAVGEAKDVEIIFSGNYIAKGKVAKKDPENNLAIITFEEFRRTPNGFSIFPSYKVKSGQNIYIVGFAGETQAGMNPAITEGTISATEGPRGDSRYFSIITRNNMPNGGSPMLDAQGRIIGIVSHAPDKAASAGAGAHLSEGTYFALKNTALLNLYPEIESMVNSDNEPPLQPQKISDMYGACVVTVVAK